MATQAAERLVTTAANVGFPERQTPNGHGTASALGYPDGRGQIGGVNGRAHSAEAGPLSVNGSRINRKAEQSGSIGSRLSISAIKEKSGIQDTLEGNVLPLSALVSAEGTEGVLARLSSVGGKVEHEEHDLSLKLVSEDAKSGSKVTLRVVDGYAKGVLVTREKDGDVVESSFLTNSAVREVAGKNGNSYQIISQKVNHREQESDVVGRDGKVSDVIRNAKRQDMTVVTVENGNVDFEIIDVLRLPTAYADKNVEAKMNVVLPIAKVLGEQDRVVPANRVSIAVGQEGIQDFTDAMYAAAQAQANRKGEEVINEIHKLDELRESQRRLYGELAQVGVYKAATDVFSRQSD